MKFTYSVEDALDNLVKNVAKVMMLFLWNVWI